MKSMEKIIEQLKGRSNLLRKAIAAAKHDEGSFPEGSLRISRGNGRIRFFQVPEDRSLPESYLKREQRDLAEALARKDYNSKFLKKAQNELDKIEKIVRQLERNNAESAYDELSEHRKSLVKPYILTDLLYAKEWQSMSFKPNPYMPEMKIYDTRRGEKVRSKSEAILADMLYRLGIPYHYERPLQLKSGKVRYPDFTLLQKVTREEIYLEHFGLLNDEEYRTNCLLKLDEYRKHGIYPGKNLLFTYESEKSPLDIKGIEKMLKDIML